MYQQVYWIIVDHLNPEFQFSTQQTDVGAMIRAIATVSSQQ